jgi:hypothetical protein
MPTRIGVVIGLVLAIGILCGGCSSNAGEGGSSGTRGEEGKRNVLKARKLVPLVGEALYRYKASIGHFPREDEGGLEALIKRPGFGGDKKMAGKWAGPYLPTEPLDPWGSKLAYVVTDPASPEAQKFPFKLWSFGPNKEDDNGANDDIRNAEWDEGGALR